MRIGGEIGKNFLLVKILGYNFGKSYFSNKFVKTDVFQSNVQMYMISNIMWFIYGHNDTSLLLP